MNILSKLNKKLFIVLVFFTIILSMNSSPVNAASVSPHYDHKLIYGINHFNYYITDSVLNHEMSGKLVNLINAAVNSWVDTGYGWNPLYAYRTYDSSISAMDIYLSNQRVEGFIRCSVTFWVGASASNPTQVVPANSNWVYTEAEMYITMMDPNNDQKLQRVFANMFGQTFGLSLNSDPSSVMCNFYTVTNAYKPNQADHNALNEMYNN